MPRLVSSSFLYFSYTDTSV